MNPNTRIPIIFELEGPAKEGDISPCGDVIDGRNTDLFWFRPECERGETKAHSILICFDATPDDSLQFIIWREQLAAIESIREKYKTRLDCVGNGSCKISLPEVIP